MRTSDENSVERARVIAALLWACKNVLMCAYALASMHVRVCILSGDEDEDSDALGGGPVHSVSDVDDFLDGLEVGHKLLVQDCTDLQWYKGRVTESVQGQVKVE